MRLCVSDNNFTVAACVSQWNHRGFYQLWKLSIIISIFNSQFFIHLAIFQFLFILPILHLLTCSLMSLISYFRSYRSSSFVTLLSETQYGIPIFHWDFHPVSPIAMTLRLGMPQYNLSDWQSATRPSSITYLRTISRTCPHSSARDYVLSGFTITDEC